MSKNRKNRGLTVLTDLECQHFLDGLAARQKPRSDGWNGVAVGEVLEKAQSAMGHS